MKSLISESGIRAVVADLARQLQISERKVVHQAIVEYAEKVHKKKKLMSFAGILKEDDADQILHTIQKSQIDKELEPGLWYILLIMLPPLAQLY